ncbi:phosphoribosyltransferase [Cryobacterium sp. Y29]|uniref:phosphoribosyltransferase n=1 Tax=Cryobacterium sp. Y29 TaxID=2048285 RepID=UPI000CE569FD|nr:phosphoribosyltransferase [Cryobacterium sp. Y29]
MTLDAQDASPPLVIDREILQWTDFAAASRELATRVRGSGFHPDVVIAIARGGLLLAGAVSYALGTKNCGSINVEFYTGIDERLPEPVLSAPMLDAPALAGKRVLLVDDVSDSGHTLALVMRLLGETAIEVRTATLYTKPRTVHVPDFTWRETDKWIVFPWSALAPVAGAPDSSAPETLADLLADVPADVTADVTAEVAA